MKVIVNIDVPELAPAVHFYTQAFGLRHSRTMDDDVAELTGASATLYLLKKGDGSAPGQRIAEGRNYNRHWTPVHLDFVVEDVKVAARRVETAGAHRESECVEWNGSRCITFSDPFGHGFCLIEFDADSYREGSVPD